MNNAEVKINYEDWENEKFIPAYSNHVQILHTAEEFVIEFFSLFPPKGVMIGRFALSPEHVKRLTQALSENLAGYEKQFGEISGPQTAFSQNPDLKG